MSLSSEYLFRELTSLVPVSLDSDDEGSSAQNEEEIVNSFKVTSKDKDTLLPSPKSEILKHFVNFVGSMFKWVFLITYRPMFDIMSVCKLLLIFRLFLTALVFFSLT